MHPASIFYMANVLLHLLLGAALSMGALFLVRRRPLLGTFLAAAVAGLYLAVAGNTRNHEVVLWLHILLGVAAVFAIAPYLTQPAPMGLPLPRSWWRLHSCRTFTSACARTPAERIRNPLTAPVSMQDEGGGPKCPFCPSSIQTNAAA